MKTRHDTLRYAMTLLLTITGTECVAQSNDFVVAIGAEHSSGDYGGDRTIEDLYVPITFGYQGESLGVGLTVPYLSVRAPSGTTLTGNDGEIIVGEGEYRTEKGLGDIIARITFFDVYQNDRLGIAVDFGAKVKLGTADEEKGLGSGKTDYSVQSNIYKYYDSYYLTGTLGYKIRGEPEGLNVDNVWFGSIGAVFRYSIQTKLGIAFDYRQSSFEDTEDIREVSLFVSHRGKGSWGLSAYTFVGFSDSSPDLGAGLSYKHYY
ncbi:hypothetical protein [Brumicola nitratireducens]|uniref:Transporter n=1 Tax=Glaciecola nitratireducens (strain JCM 12485 / KCTC 12276 / FR1064) TaxID=1085623 RepID=G4QKL5_GLANF|nr:hypothetical protein [Glaciecola nitratireducens]AEP30081.1 hypothetical protein GNIT_1972 [Glaciecola nitratireducens FR1064]